MTPKQHLPSPKAHLPWLQLAAFIVLLLVGAALVFLRDADGAAPEQPAPTRPLQMAPRSGLEKEQRQFDGEKAWEDVAFQVNLGPRTPGSPAHTRVIDWMSAELQDAGWAVEIQEGEISGRFYRNVVARRGHGSHWIILGAHYDSRLVADRDPDPAKRDQPVPGGNDGASGVAVLLELARVLPRDLTGEVWLVFFDLEDNGNLPGYDWIMGSQAFVSQLDGKPEAAIIIDMIGDADQQMYLEGNSDPNLSAQIWAAAAELGYSDRFISELRHTIIDDHVPFVRAGIPAVDIIDIEYPYWHTTADTADKVSPDSLQAVGDTLIAWLKATLR